MPKTRPVIGITTFRGHQTGEMPRIKLNENYVEAVLRAGGAPLLIPVGFPVAHVPELCTLLNGILLSGGGDIDPAIFNGKPDAKISGVDRDRDEIEIALAKFAARNHMPLFGICRGLQVINVALGGTLYTHVKDQLPGAIQHSFLSNHPRDYLAHSVRIEKNSRLKQLISDDTVDVNSLHHQGIEQLAQGLTATAWSPDGLVEAFEIDGHPFGIGVQWHPECLPDIPAQQEIFTSFVNACAN